MGYELITTSEEAEFIVKDCNERFDAIRALGEPCDGKCTLENGKTIHLVSTLNGVRKVNVRHTLPIDYDDFLVDYFDAMA